MPVNSMYTDFPPQPDNPTDEERNFLGRFALMERGRPEDFDYIKCLTKVPPDITTIARPGEFRGRRVGVIGGGAAGMAAAFELRKLGFDITIFEAHEDRIGGRIYTHYFDKDKTLYGEMGAMRFPVTHETVWHYINLFRLNTRTFIQSNNNGFIYLRDTRTRNDAEGKNVKRDIYPKYNLAEWERKLAWQQLVYLGYESHLLQAGAAMRSEILQVKPWYNPYTLYWDSKSNRQMLQSAMLSKDAINLISSLSPLSGGFLYNNYIDFIEEDYSADLSFLYEITGGAVNLPLAFYKSFVDEKYSNVYGNISKEYLGSVTWKGGCLVTGISRNGNTGMITLSFNSKTDIEIFHKDFEYVVCAIPFSTLRNVEIDPLFTPEKMQAIKEVTYGNALKSALLCKKRFWEEGKPEEQIIGGPSYTDLPLTTIWYPSDHVKCSSDKSGSIADSPNTVPSREPGVLLIYNFNQDATRLGNLPDDLHFKEIKDEIEKVHGLPEGYLNEIAVELKTVNWNTEQYFRGAFCFFSPEQKRLFSYCMAIPEYNNRVFFAGEHISAKHRWVQGALKSGMDAANELAWACRHNKR